jgi:hypothetical protein
LQGLLANHPTPIYLCGDRFQPALFIRGGRVQDHRAANGLWCIRPRRRLHGLRLIEWCRRHFGGAQSQRQRAPLMLN